MSDKERLKSFILCDYLIGAKDILQAFNMTEATVKKEAGILGEQLRSVTN